MDLAYRTAEEIDEIELDRELAKRSFKEFVKAAWHIVEPSRPFVGNWSIDALCEHLEAVYYEDIYNLLVNVPPGTMKSVGCCVMFPAWVWSQNPKLKFLFGTFADFLAKRDGLRTKNLVNSDWFEARWGGLDIYGGSTLFRNKEGGFRMATTVRGAATGEHADFQIIDDPIKPLDVTGSLQVSQNTCQEVITWHGETMGSRFVDLQRARRVVIAQRLVENDLPGHLIENADYTKLILPMRFDSRRKCVTSIGFEDPRTKDGELLFPERFPEKEVSDLEKTLGSRGTAAQLQQDPIAAGGNIIKEDWLQTYTVLPKSFSLLIQSWDMTFKSSDNSDFVCGQVWGMFENNYYLIDQEHGRWGFVDSCAAVRRLTAKHPKARIKLVEAKANGEAIVDQLKRSIPGFKLINPEGGKISRVHAVETIFESGQVFVPEGSWVWGPKGFVSELIKFPAAMNDDMVDSCTQALVYLEKKSLVRLKQAMKNANRSRM